MGPKNASKIIIFHQKWASRFQISMQTLYFWPLSICKWSKNDVQKSFIFHFKFMIFPLQNHRFLRSQCIDGLQKLNKSCKKKIIIVDRKIIIFSVQNQRVHRYLYVNGPKNMCENHSFFIANSCFSLQNHHFLCSRCIDALKKLNKSCKKPSFFIEKPSFFREKINVFTIVGI